MRRAERKKYFFRARGRVFRISDLRKQDHEFVSALAADRVRTAYSRQQSLGNGLKKLVADGMSQRIVDVFETIQIQKDHGNRVVLAVSQGNGLRDSVVEQHAIGEIGDKIVLSGVGHLERHSP